MRPDRLYLTDIVDAVAAIERFSKDLDESAFLASELHQSAVLQKLIVMGESAARFSTELREKHPEVEWREIVAFRNFAVHAYFSVDWRIVWNTARTDAPAVGQQVQTILDRQS